MRLLLIVLLGSIFHCANAQKLNKVLDRLLAADVPDGIFIKNNSEDQLSLNNAFYERKQHMYVRWKGQLYLLLGGTGHILQLSKTSDTSFTYVKIDSTIFNGNNFGSFSFVSDSVLYNFGGYGHWRHNGQLRRYNVQAHEWDIVALNEEVAFKVSQTKSFAFTNFPENTALYITERTVGNQFTKTDQKDRLHKLAEIWMLDIHRGDWKKLGKLNPLFTKSSGEYAQIMTSSIGTIIAAENQYYLYNHRSPKLYKLKSKSYLGEFLIRTLSENAFCIDSTMYVGSFKYNTLDSAKISLLEFEETNIPLYAPEKNKYLVPSIAIVSVLLMVSGLFIYYKRKKGYKLLDTKNGSLDVDSFLEEKELTILTAILQNSERNLDTYIEQLNQLLGIERKNIDVQKKQRSEVLISTNSKLGILLNVTEQIIQKKRVETDKRSFCYFIAPENIQRVKDLIG